MVANLSTVLSIVAVLFKPVYRFNVVITIDFIYKTVYSILMVLESTVSIAKVGTKSVRATVPEGIVSYLEIEVGDKLEWRMDSKNDERVAIVSRKKDHENKDTMKIASQYIKVDGE